MGRWIGERLNLMEGPVRFLLPEGGVSALDEAGKPFYDPAARRGAVRRARGERAADRVAPARARSASHQRSGICGRAGRSIFARCMAHGRARARGPARISSMAAIERAALLDQFHAMIARGEPIVGGGAGTGLSAKCEEAGGIDLIVIYNSGRYRMAGRGSLAGLMPYGDANAIVMEMAAEVLPVVKHTPVLAGVNGTDPFRSMERFLDEVKAAGLLRRAELSRPSASSTAASAPSSRKPACPTGSKST